MRRVPRRIVHPAIRVVLTLIPCALLAACSSRGHGRLPPDRFNYNQAVAQSSSEQMLLNIVRLRYSDVPEFLGVTSVLTQYVFTASGSVSGVVGTSVGEDANSAGVGGRATFIERPTITFSPLKGEDFVKQMLTPIPSEALFSLVQSGWPADLLLMLGIERVNDVVNIPFHPAAPQSLEDAQEFDRGIEILLGLAYRGAIELQVERQGAEVEAEPVEQRYLVFADDPDHETQILLAEARELFGLDPGFSRFRVTTQAIGRKPDEITLRNRSLVSLMGFLSRGVEPPEAHFDEQRVDSLVEAGEFAINVPLRVLSSVERPEGAAVAIQYEGHWFYIEGSDTQSREAFGLVRYLHLLMSPRVDGSAPIVTIPAG